MLIACCGQLIIPPVSWFSSFRLSQGLKERRSDGYRGIQGEKDRGRGRVELAKKQS